MIFFVFEIIMKGWSYGPKNFFRSSSAHILEAVVAFTCFVRLKFNLILNV
jgi:hypothetical protein